MNKPRNTPLVLAIAVVLLAVTILSACTPTTSGESGPTVIEVYDSETVYFVSGEPCEEGWDYKSATVTTSHSTASAQVLVGDIAFQLSITDDTTIIAEGLQAKYHSGPNDHVDIFLEPSIWKQASGPLGVCPSIPDDGLDIYPLPAHPYEISAWAGNVVNFVRGICHNPGYEFVSVKIMTLTPSTAEVRVTNRYNPVTLTAEDSYQISDGLQAEFDPGNGAPKVVFKYDPQTWSATDSSFGGSDCPPDWVTVEVFIGTPVTFIPRGTDYCEREKFSLNVEGFDEDNITVQINGNPEVYGVADHTVILADGTILFDFSPLSMTAVLTYNANQWQQFTGTPPTCP